MNSVITNPVGRPREFDESTVLDAAMDVFWRKGYEKTSMADLLKATGLHKGSLYQAFGDKHSLFIRALKRYVEMMKCDMTEIMQAAPCGLEGIRSAIYHNIDLACHGDGVNSGCLALNALVDKGGEDPEALAVLETSLVGRLGALTAAVSRAQEEGDIRSDRPAEIIANMINALVMGLGAGLRGGIDRQGSRRLTDEFLSALAAVPQ
jgi:TetR/AcrR family transcriptional repressor of nem operon